MAWPLLYDARLPMTDPSSSPRPAGGTESDRSPDPQISVVMSTYNRGALLEAAVRSVLEQETTSSLSFEMIVVDNNSSDGTRGVLERLAATDRRLRYVFEAKQGSSHGRNTGIKAAQGPLIAFLDDDVRAEPDWLETIARAFEEHPEADVVGGRVLPLWPSPPPAWLTPEHWSPLALVDFGDTPFAIDPGHPICLVGANLGVRRTVFEAVGGFEAAFQLVGSRFVGSVEDHEFLLRVLRSGRTAIYDPRITVHAEVQPNRLDRAYHRRWHTGHGHFHSLLRTESMERTRVGTLAGVPAHLYRRALGDLAGWLVSTLRGQRERAFVHELRVRFFLGFFRERRREFMARPREHRREEWRALLFRALAGAASLRRRTVE